MWERYPMNWLEGLKGRILFDEPLSRHTSFKIGGPVDIWYEPWDLGELKQLLDFSNKEGISLFPIGYGSNLLVSDKGLRAMAICLSSSYFKKLNFDNETVVIGSGRSLNELVIATRDMELGGCEFLAGIPGTVGGAVVSNAGAKIRNTRYQPKSLCCRAGISKVRKKSKLSNTATKNCELANYFSKSKTRILSIGDLVEEMTVIDFNGEIETLKKNEMKFGYRTSNLSNCIILNTKLKLKKKNKNEISFNINEFLSYKRKTQELTKASAGCIFKNPQTINYNIHLSTSRGKIHRIFSNKNIGTTDGLTAGRLIELSGLKGIKVGDAQVSTKHGNFIINLGKATANDVLKLVEFVQNEVSRKYGVWLELEIKIVGE